MDRFILFLLLQFVVNALSEDNNDFYRLCVPRSKKTNCEQMINDLDSESGKIRCVFANGKIGCIERVIKNEADFLSLEPEEIYVAQKFRRYALNVIAEVRTNEFKNRDYRYEPVVVIRKTAGIKSISDLRGKKSCHTGFGRNAGWKIPFSHLMEFNELPELCNEIKGATPDRDLYAFSKYFYQACAPGPWVTDKGYDADLRAKYPNLCQLCKNPRDCNDKDKYAGYDGALKCLTENDGDVAWTKMDAVIPFFQLNTQSPSAIASNYAFLCWDGSSQPLTSKSPCSWAKRPWKAILASYQLNSNAIKNLQKEISKYLVKAKATSDSGILPLWDVNVLEINSTSESFYPYEHNQIVNPYEYNRERNYTVTIEKPSCSTDRRIRICVRNVIEKYKCMDLSLGALGKRVVPGFDCILADTGSDCYAKVNGGGADVVIASAKEAATAKAKYGLTPILNALEIIDQATIETASYKFALAVINSDSTIKNLTDLRGKKSCHGSVRSLSGWNVVLRRLNEAGLISGPTCGLSIEMAKFFNSSCVPGILKAKETMPWLPDSLCDLCAGNSDAEDPFPTKVSVCADGPTERYFGNGGALRCLSDGVADVAFVDHVGLLHDSKGFVDLNSTMLLCPNGQVMNVFQYRHCNWGKIPSMKILAKSGDDWAIDREDAKLSLLKASAVFGPTADYNVMKLFGPYYNNPNVLLPDSSAGLAIDVSDSKMDEIIEAFDFCTTSMASIVLPQLLIIPILTFAAFTYN